jgi:hypothetical protein
MGIKTCVTCGAEFEARSNRQAYCSEACKHGSATCRTCGKGFVRTKGTTGEFCSTECWYSSDRGPRNKPVRVAAPRIEKPKRERASPVTKACPSCGSEFVTRVARQECCSRSCARTIQNQRNGNPAWRGGINRHANGYLKQLAKGHPAADHRGYVMQHRLVMERQLGRHLLPHERVHHKNGIRDDNRPENLELWVLKGRSKKDPAGQRVDDLIAHAVSVAERYGIHPPAVRSLLEDVLYRGA